MKSKTKNLPTANSKLAATIEKPEARRAIRQHLLGFELLYLSHYFTLERASFHPELIKTLGDQSKQFIARTGFRGSAKSTHAHVGLPLWAALEKKTEFIVLINETEQIAKLSIANIRHELENNENILRDYGDVVKKESGTTTFTETNIVLANGVRILGLSRGQKIRGLRHREHRPGLVVADDIEERERVHKKEYRDKTEEWLRGDVIPAAEEAKARVIVIGNMLHTDGIMARLKKDELFDYKEYPLLKDGEVTWKAKYPSDTALRRQEHKVGPTAWLREYLLKVVPPKGAPVKQEWIRYWDKLPDAEVIAKTGVGVDLAISEKQTADFTAMVSGILCITDDGPKVYVLPYPVNEHFTFHETQEEMRSIHAGLAEYAHPTFYIEDVAYQKSALQEAQRMGLSVEGVRPGRDKRARLKTAANYIQNGTVLFPRRGAEDLLTQMLGFGVEEHDDLVDSFVYCVIGLVSEGLELPTVRAL